MNLKALIKSNTLIYKLLLNTRSTFRILYNTKRRSRFFWELRNGDNKLSLNYPLNKNSIVFDIGAYEGNFTEKIYTKFECNVHAFEPLEEYCEFLRKKFLNFNKVKILNFGLLDENNEFKISNIGESSSIYTRPEGELNTIVKMKRFSEYISDNEIQNIDLVYMNIEGSEYPLIEHIISEGIINNIQHLQIQFHNFVPNSKQLRKNIRDQLSKTHKCKFNFPFIWESWSVKN